LYHIGEVFLPEWVSVPPLSMDELLQKSIPENSENTYMTFKPVKSLGRTQQLMVWQTS